MMIRFPRPTRPRLLSTSPYTLQSNTSWKLGSFRGHERVGTWCGIEEELVVVLGIRGHQPVGPHRIRAATPVNDHCGCSTGRELGVLVCAAQLAERQQLQVLLLLDCHTRDRRGGGERQQVIRTRFREKEREVLIIHSSETPKARLAEGATDDGIEGRVGVCRGSGRKNGAGPALIHEHALQLPINQSV